ALLLSDGWRIPGEVHWELDGKGILIFAIKEGVMSFSPVVLGENQLGLWTHLATVYAPQQHSLTTYVNGQAVQNTLHLNHRVIQPDELPSGSRVVIGGANIGNYADPPPTELTDKLIRNLNGRIDEFIIFDHALDAGEVRSIYEVGKPTS